MSKFVLLRVWPGWYAKKTQGLYAQFMAAARVISTEKFVVGVTNGRERDKSQVSYGKVEWALRAWSLLRFETSGSVVM